MPTLNVVSQEDMEFLELLHELSPEQKREVRGLLAGFLLAVSAPARPPRTGEGVIM